MRADRDNLLNLLSILQARAVAVAVAVAADAEPATAPPCRPQQDRRVSAAPINGRGKAAFFEAYGFSRARWDELHRALLDHAAKGRVSDAVVSPYGSRRE